QPDRQVGAGTAEPNSVEAALVQLGRAAHQRRDVLLPGRNGVGLVQANRGPDRVPEALEVRLAEHLPRPGRGRERDDRPGDLTAIDRGPDRPAAVRNARLDHALCIEALEEVGIRLADDADERGLALGLLLDTLEHPRRRPTDGFVGGELGPCAPDVTVGVLDLDEPRALLVGDPGHRPDERRVLDLADDRDVLPPADVDADPNREPGVLLQLCAPIGPERFDGHVAWTLPGTRTWRTWARPPTPSHPVDEQCSAKPS